MRRGDWTDARCQAYAARARAYQAAGQRAAVVLAGQLAGRYALLAVYERRAADLDAAPGTAPDAAALAWELSSDDPVMEALPRERAHIAELEAELAVMTEASE